MKGVTEWSSKLVRVIAICLANVSITYALITCGRDLWSRDFVIGQFLLHIRVDSLPMVFSSYCWSRDVVVRMPF